MQEGSTDGAKSALSGFQQMVQNQLTKMENDFKNGKPFPDFPVIQDHKAFHVRPCHPSHKCLSLSHNPGSSGSHQMPDREEGKPLILICTALSPGMPHTLHTMCAAMGFGSRHMVF